MDIYIKKTVVKNILNISKKIHPKEFIGLLSGKVFKKNGKISKIYVTKLIIPSGAVSGKGFASYPIYKSPYNTLGTIHSHPTNPTPSFADLNLFSTNGFIHIIVSYPYSFDKIKFYSSVGDEVKRVFIMGENDERSNAV